MSGSDDGTMETPNCGERPAELPTAEDAEAGAGKRGEENPWN
jgi:hypothetical protein